MTEHLDLDDLLAAAAAALERPPEVRDALQCRGDRGDARRLVINLDNSG